MEERFMLLELLMQDERREGRKEGMQQGQLKMAKKMLQMTLEKFGQLSDTLLKTLQEQQDIEVIETWMQTALTAQSLDEFISKM